MSDTIEVRVPDIGDFKDVPVIEVLVKPGDRVKKNDSLITLESEKGSAPSSLPPRAKLRSTDFYAARRWPDHLALRNSRLRLLNVSVSSICGQ